ncbi:ribosome silencing factor [Tuanshanicoccus lijuaniae]|uniref:ribosome silencing factor n=1 Tax=Aerococcaceae bacterium zg-1292 TaxID=2774330 RepID=UPI0019389669|nr:ribosome silencing factor [Aerococcaceae bacterium zg-1292]MBF6978211.1 ribosome silencing factor [Aerococcaceae bacterium zg-BR22]MBS4456429.1 ribosome silencing factor [Aerococcaceae bacterium zg-A91]MBS4458279.1 ribosome silencing factor [Aerococcaceae bacterium zg-BR33]QQA37489.1 ribosome silencing factor [Aerococcaceae bacterium zg-1292]
MTKTTLEKLEVIVRAADDRMAQDIMALDVANVTPIADYFVIMHARNEKQLDAVVQSILEAAHQASIAVKQVEGKDGGKWVLIDLVDIIVHVFYYSERTHYNLEKIWQDAPAVDISAWISENNEF